MQVSKLQVMAEADGGTVFGFRDLDGNSWAVQEVKGASVEAADPDGAHRAQRVGGKVDAAQGPAVRRALPRPSDTGLKREFVERAGWASRRVVTMIMDH